MPVSKEAARYIPRHIPHIYRLTHRPIGLPTDLPTCIQAHTHINYINYIYYSYIYIFVEFCWYIASCDYRFCWTLLARNRWNNYLPQRKSNSIRPPCDAQSAPIICRGHGGNFGKLYGMQLSQKGWHKSLLCRIARHLRTAPGCVWFDPVLVSQSPYSCGLRAECTEIIFFESCAELSGVR